MPWEKTDYRCPKCGELGINHFVVLDEAGTVTVIMSKHLCGQESIFHPELMELVEGRKMNWKTRFHNFSERMEVYFDIKGANAYEVLGRLVATTIFLASIASFGLTIIYGLSEISLQCETNCLVGVPLLYLTNFIGAYLIVKIFSRPTTKKE